MATLHLDLEALARAVDTEARPPGSESLPGRLFGIRLAGPGAGRRVSLEELARGEARDLPCRTRPPAGLSAIALVASGWAAPMEEDGTMTTRPSRHPARRRVEITTLVAGGGEDVTILRDGTGTPPQVLRGGVGVIHERLLRCWARRPEAGGRLAG